MHESADPRRVEGNSSELFAHEAEHGDFPRRGGEGGDLLGGRVGAIGRRPLNFLSQLFTLRAFRDSVVSDESAVETRKLSPLKTRSSKMAL